MKVSKEKSLKIGMAVSVFGVVLFAILGIWALGRENWSAVLSAAAFFILFIVKTVQNALALAKEKSTEPADADRE